ncbi:protein trapped in endoderm-1-like [Ostrea edulis]|uniref:protein trapped in endoderm-1-like n=1 Tax=Ostrea edulis TaxID=37623 RepID=UPI0020942C1E|nr:protein trapped in endoderm-1-like [Ostrea edulis]
MSSRGNISEASPHYHTSQSVFAIHVVGSTTLLVTGILVNAFSIGVIIRLKLYRETSVLFTLHLMFVNLTAIIIGMPLALLNSFHPIVKKDMFCRMSGFIVFGLIGVQMCNITLLSVSAYVKVAQGTFGKVIFSRTRNTVSCLVFIWVLPFANMSMPMSEIWGEFAVSLHQPWCFPFSGTYGTFLVCFTLVVTLSALLFSYVGIVRTVVRSRRKVEAANQLPRQNRKKFINERQLIITLIIMATSYIILFLPSGLLPVTDPDSRLGVDLHVIFTYIMWSQNVVETLIYSVLHTKIRHGIKLFFICKKADTVLG